MKTHNVASLERAAAALREADALLIGAGAGMGVDAGLPDYRGTLGFWRDYPPTSGQKVDWERMARGQWFLEDPAGAWGFFGHTRQLFARAIPHAGYDALRDLAARMVRGARIYSSNVDGHFQRAGFHERAILECHGSMFYLQCAEMCSREVWHAPELALEVDEASMRLTSPPPTCPRCGQVARPNVLLFGDNLWTCSRHAEQMRRYVDWREALGGARLVVLELGAGKVIPTVREQCEAVAERFDATLIRVNPFEAECEQGIGLPMGACAALTQLARRVTRSS